MSPIFVELLDNGMENNGKDMRLDDAPKDYRLISFKNLYKMFGNDIEMDYSYCCFSNIPKENGKATRFSTENNEVVDNNNDEEYETFFL